MDKLSDLLLRHPSPEKQRYITQEFQDFGYRMAVELGEEKRKGMYIKLAKSKSRSLLEQTLQYVSDYPNAKNKGKLFMWRLKEMENSASDQPSEIDNTASA
jgi:hypothetical protein